MNPARRGLLAGIGSYLLWGLFPLYWHLLDAITPLELLAQRIAWAVLTVGLLILVLRRVGEVKKAFAHRRDILVLAAASVLIAINWGVYILAVNSGHAIDGSLGYFTTPLVAVALGVSILGERLRALQWIALGIAASALIVLSIEAGRPPWIALILACSFSLYSLLKKLTPLAPLTGLMVETTVLAPVALITLALIGTHGGGLQFVHHGAVVLVLVMLSGIVTAVPLLLFAVSAKTVSLTTLGLLQYINPVMQLAIGVFVLHEPMPLPRLIGFAMVWIALILFTADAIKTARHNRALATTETRVTDEVRAGVGEPTL